MEPDQRLQPENQMIGIEISSKIHQMFLRIGLLENKLHIVTGLMCCDQLIVYGWTSVT